MQYKVYCERVFRSADHEESPRRLGVGDRARPPVLPENHRALEQDVDARAAAATATTPSTASTQQANQGFLFGRVTYTDFPPGRPLTGSVTTRAGRRLTGRLVYDLDESETTETLDAPSQGVDYTIPFGLITSIVPVGREERGAQRARVTLHDGEELQLERTGDLGEGNAGILIFVDGREHADTCRGPT